MDKRKIVYRPTPPLWLDVSQALSPIAILLAIAVLVGLELSAALILAGGAAASCLLVLRMYRRRHPVPVVHTEAGILHFRQEGYIPPRTLKVPLAETKAVHIVGRPRQRSFVFVMASGDRIEAKVATGSRRLENDIVRFLEQHIPQVVLLSGYA